MQADDASQRFLVDMQLFPELQRSRRVRRSCPQQFRPVVRDNDEARSENWMPTAIGSFREMGLSPMQTCTHL
jgi:hypothetical protein